ncbi:hypothetical protein C7E18_06440 [Stenotrophomonas maltophilia]|nr:hypothetical protein C7E18_06440 [Stenotrophomonas maltophilia]
MESGACAQQGGGGKQPGKQRRGEVGRLDEYNRALNAVTTALVGGVAGQGAGQVASNALAAYAAYFIGSKLDPNHGSDPNATLQLLSHAILGALLAEANGGNAGTGAVSAAGGELAAKVLTNTLTGGDPSKLSPEQKEVVLALSQVVGALAGGLLGCALAGGIPAGMRLAGRNRLEMAVLGPVSAMPSMLLRSGGKSGNNSRNQSNWIPCMGCGGAAVALARNQHALEVG